MSVMQQRIYIRENVEETCHRSYRQLIGFVCVVLWQVQRKLFRQYMVLSAFFTGYSILVFPSVLFLKRTSGKSPYHSLQLIESTFSIFHSTLAWVVFCLGEKPFECKVCHRKFARAGDLRVHSPVHHDEKPYKCEQCFKTFTRFSSLKEHTRLHTGTSSSELFS